MQTEHGDAVSFVSQKRAKHDDSDPQGCQEKQTVACHATASTSTQRGSMPPIAAVQKVRFRVMGRMFGFGSEDHVAA
ncbi:MAG: hypothetical protein DCF28_00840 [Alphaproteobacteria bacterium]|nr:MAG: hypothetical protein DCF28_00840 [Alphaproteobacteria bacterium]